jgi:hypothetical protein
MKHHPTYVLLVLAKDDKSTLFIYYVEEVVNHTLYRPGQTITGLDITILQKLDVNIVYRTLLPRQESK